MAKAIKYIKVKWYKYPIQRYKQWRARRWLKKHFGDICGDSIVFNNIAYQMGKLCEKTSDSQRRR